MKTQDKGDFTEAAVITELKRRDISVSLPFGDNERYDLVLETPEGRMLRAQVKTGWNQGGSVVFKGYSLHTNSAGNQHKRYTDGIDCFLVFSHDFDRLFLVWVDEIGSNMTLRVEEPDQRHATTNWAEDYELDERWPPADCRPRPMLDARSPAAEPVRDALQTREIPFVRVEDEPFQFIAANPSGGRQRLRACTGSVVDGRIRFNTITAELDAYCIHCSDREDLYLIPDEQFSKSISLRVDRPDQSDASINWAADYAFDEQWPL